MSSSKKMLSMADLDFDQASVLLKDRFYLRRQLKKLRDKAARLNFDSQEDSSPAIKEGIARFQQAVQHSQAVLTSRKAQHYHLQYSEGLPISEARDKLLALLQDHQVVIVAGETGSGKTTQLPKMCLELNRGLVGRIGHTQPRRLAARAVSARIAEELNVELGELVGYQFRFHEKFNDNTRIKLMTDGILLAEIKKDRYLNEYDTLIIDEAHERSLNIDFLLGYIKLILPKRKDLKVIITSATIDTQRFAGFFSGAPLIEVSGRSYPVDIKYLEDLLGETSADEDEGARQDFSSAEKVQLALDDIEFQYKGGHGPRDVLVFLPGEREIRDQAKVLKDYGNGRLEILPLYARLSQAEQQRVFKPSHGQTKRRVILATNVAETSVTVPGIGYVIDLGISRISRYSSRSQLQRLPIEPISQASANQRAGRCGRIAPGVCYRLYAEDDFNARAEFTEPEILRTHLASVILQMKALRFIDIRQFPFIEAPDERLIKSGIKTLQALQALDQKGELSAEGRQLAQLPIDPRLAKMLLVAAKENCLSDVLIIVSALAVQDPREFPPDKRQAADEKHRRFWHAKSDFISWINFWHYIELQREALSSSQFRKLCQKEFIAYMRVREWRNTHRQLLLVLKTLFPTSVLQKSPSHFQPVDGCNQNNEKDCEALAQQSLASIHKALLSGLIHNIGKKDKKLEYRGAKNQAFFISPGSSQFKKAPPWLMAAEILETKKVFAHTVAAIEPEWVMHSAGHLLKYQYAEPYWHYRRQQVLASRSTTLYGLLLESGKRVNFEKIDVAASRIIFIREALVAGQFKSNLPFWQKNTALINQVKTLEEKYRRRDLLLNEDHLYAFYDRVLPQGICGKVSLEKWYRHSTASEKKLLLLDERDVLLHDGVLQTVQQFPDTLVNQGNHLPLSYCFLPGDSKDGVTVKISLGQLSGLSTHRFDWLVPGLLKDKCIDMIKLLPKQLRKKLVPIPQLVERLFASLQLAEKEADDVFFEQVNLFQILIERIRIEKQVDIQLAEWQALCKEQLDSYFTMRFEIVDEKGQLIDSGRDIIAIIDRCRDRLSSTVKAYADDHFRRQAITRWDFEDLTDKHSYQRDGAQLHGYPVLRDAQETVCLDLAPTLHEAGVESRRGVARLLLLSMSDKSRYIKKNFCKDSKRLLPYIQVGTREQLMDDLLLAVAAEACLSLQGYEGVHWPKTQAEFNACLEKGRAEMIVLANQFEEVVYKMLDQLHLVYESLEKRRQHFPMQEKDIRAQLERLIYPGFLFATRLNQLKELPRFLQAIVIRLDRLSGFAAKDNELCEKIASIEQNLQDLLYEYTHAVFSDPTIAQFRWMLEELRVSLFAQQLKTKHPVSLTRVEKQWKKIDHTIYPLINKAAKK